jgi:translocation and assembly module TamB
MARSRSYKALALTLATVLSIVLGLGFLAISYFRSDDERGLLAELISRALSTPTSTVSIGAIEGPLSSNATIHDLKVSDRDGVWLKIDRIRIIWNRLALLNRRLEINKLDINEVDVARKPLPSDSDSVSNDKPLIPELPLLVDIKQFALARINFGEPVLGDAASFSTGGYAKIGRPSQGLALFLDAQRLDQPATFNLRLNYTPDGEHLGVIVRLDEPAGGILSRMGRIPGRPPVKLDIAGAGPLDAFTAKLGFDAGAAATAHGAASLTRDGLGRRLALDIAGDIAGLLPPMAAPIFAGTSKLSGDVFLGDDSAITINKFELEAPVARLDVSGGVSAAQIADVNISARNMLNAENHTAVKEAKIERLVFDAHVAGALESPIINSTLNIEGGRLPDVALARLTAHFNAAPSGSLASASTLLQLSADANATGLSFSDPALAEAIGSEPSFTMRGVGALKGVVDFQTLELRTQAISAGFKGRAGPDEVNGRLEATSRNLAFLGKLSGLALKGDASFISEIEGEPSRKRFATKVDARFRGFASGVEPIDRLVGGNLTLTGGAKHDSGSGFSFDNLLLTAVNASARINGAATAEKSDVTATIDVPDLSKADGRVSGKGAFSAHLTGPLSRPAATAEISIRDGVMLGRPVPRLDLQAEAADLTGALVGTVNLKGEIDRKPARGSLQIAWSDADGMKIDGVDLRIGSFLTQGGAVINTAKLVAGDFTIRADSLDDLSPLLLQKLSGALDARATLTQAEGRQDAALKASLTRFQGFGASLDRLTADLALTDVYRRPAIQGAIDVNEARVGAETISRIRLDAKGGIEASEIALMATARGFDFKSRARLFPSEPPRLEVASFDAVRGDKKIGLLGPTTLIFKDGGVDLRALAMNIGGGRLTLDGRAGSKLDLRAQGRAIPLSMADLVSPGLGLSGTLEGEVAIGGTAAAPTGPYRVKIAKLTGPQTRSAGLPPIDIDAKGSLESSRTALEALISIGDAGSIRIAGDAPLTSTGPLDLAVRGAVDGGLANRSLSASGQRLTGSLALDGRVTGTVQQPRASGSLLLSNGSFQDAALGVRLDAITARLLAQNDRIVIESASAKTPNGGLITSAGSIRLDTNAGFPADIHVTGRNAQLTRTAVQTAVADLDLAISGPLARLPKVSGNIDIESLDITIPDRLPSSLQPLPGTRHISPTPTALARIALAAAKNNKAKGATPFDVALDLTIDAPGRIRVQGRGLDVNLGGSLRLTGTLAQPKPVGAFHLKQGRLQLLTSDLDFSRANLTFAGDLSPQLDFLATTQAGNASVGVAITGDPADPQFTFTSSPDMPQDEILSRLLFGAPSGQLSPTQALALAEAAAIYSGGNSALSGLRRSLGLGAGNSSNPLSRILGDRVSIGVRTGATPAQTGVGMTVNIYKQLKAKGSINAQGAASVGVGAEHEW